MKPTDTVFKAWIISAVAFCFSGLIGIGTLSAAEVTDAASIANPLATERARNQLNTILEQPLYQRWRQRRDGSFDGIGTTRTFESPAWITAIRKTIGKWFTDLMNWIGRLLRNYSSSSSGPNTWSFTSFGALMPILEFLGWTAIVIGTLGVLYFIVRAWRSSDRRPREAGVLSREQLDIALSEGDALSQAGTRWLDEADRRLRAGDLRNVYRSLYLALLAGLHENQRIVFRKNRTNWYYVRRFRGQPEDREVFRSLTWLFDDVWYGRYPVAESRIDAVQREVTRLIDLGAPTVEKRPLPSEGLAHA